MSAAHFSVVECPACGRPLPVTDMILPGEPQLTVVTCKVCSQLIEVKRDPAIGQLVAKVAKPA